MSIFNNFFQVFIIVVPILTILVFIFTILLIFSPRLRGKFMSRQVKALKNMTDYSKDDMESIIKNLGDVSVNGANNIINQNEDTLKNISQKQARINECAIKMTAHAIKEGLIDEDKIFCKYCGIEIDKDSKFCKFCGKEQ